MKKCALFFSFTLSLFLTLDLFAQPKYPVSAIAPALLKDAHAVKRMEEISFEVISLHEAIYRQKYALTILDEAGERYATFHEGYDRLRKINGIEGALYDATGNQLKKLKGKDINDYSAVSNISLFEDNRIKVHDFNYRSYPYTVEYEVEVVFNHTYMFPRWTAQEGEDLSVERSGFTFIAPEGYNLRYKAFNCKATAMSAEKNKKIIKWEVSSLPAMMRPFASPPWHELTPTVFFAPSEFELDGLKGDCSSWLNYGKFQLVLNKDRDKLPPEVLQKVMQIAQSSISPKEKVFKLYEFMQQHVRYVNISLGIGGWQPFEAAFVAQKGYGDCKGLSNYMYSILKAAGITSHYTKIWAGTTSDDQDMMEDFPSGQSNHIVLCVPLAKDTIWLECTDQFAPAGYMGGFTGNRKALAVTEEGGKLVCTPRYGVDENLEVRKINATADEEGNLTASVNTLYKAMRQDDLSWLVAELTKEKLKKYLNERLDFSTYDINAFSYKSTKSTLPELEENLKLYVSNYATVSGRRFFIAPNLMTRSSRKTFNTEERTADFVFGYGYRDVDTVEIKLPAGYQLEAVPQPTHLKTAYGNYSCEVKVDGTMVVCYRKMERFGGRFAAKEAVSIAKFYEDIYKADRSRVVLVRKEDAAPKAGM